MISRMIFWSAQLEVIRRARLGTDAFDFEQPFRRTLDDLEYRLIEGTDQALGEAWADPLVQPKPKYFSMPLAEVGAVVRKKAARNCSPCSRLFSQVPLA
jgi:hypothetical protein